jgi:hypothetical protein
MTVPERVFWIASMPRSGSSWLSQVFAANRRVRFRMAPLYSSEFSGTVGACSTDEEWMRFFSDVFEAKGDFLCQERRRREGDFPDLAADSSEQRDLVIKDVRNHQVSWNLVERKELPVRVVYLVRDPRAAIWSWMRNDREFPSGGRDDDWRTGGTRKLGEGEYWGFNDWVGVTKRYLELGRAHPGRVEVIRFEELCERGAEAFKALFERLGLSFEDGSAGFLGSSWGRTSDRPYSVYRDRWSVLRSWEGGIPTGVESAIVEEVRTNGLEEFLYGQ